MYYIFKSNAMKKNLIFIIIAFLSVSLVTAQDFKIVQVTLKNGQVYKGKKGTLTGESISFLSNQAQKTFPLTDVTLVQAKEGKAGKWALAMGGGCLGVGIIVSVTQGGKYNEVSGETYDTGTLLLGSFLWAGIFAGGGALIGSASDKWQNVYISKATSMLKYLNINFVPTKYAKVNIGFTYKF